MGLGKYIGDAEVVYGADCLFGIVDGKARWGVRQQFQEPGGVLTWYHHYWGINSEDDAKEIADRINNPRRRDD